MLCESDYYVSGAYIFIHIVSLLWIVAFSIINCLFLCLHLMPFGLNSSLFDIRKLISDFLLFSFAWYILAHHFLFLGFLNYFIWNGISCAQHRVRFCFGKIPYFIKEISKLLLFCLKTVGCKNLLESGDYQLYLAEKHFILPHCTVSVPREMLCSWH